MRPARSFTYSLIIWVMALTFSASPAAQAQVQVVIAPSWGPPLPAGCRYHYLPEVGGYYDGLARQVPRGGRWVRAEVLAGYQPARSHPVIVVDYRGQFPWFYDDDYHARYLAHWDGPDEEYEHHDWHRRDEGYGHHDREGRGDEHRHHDRHREGEPERREDREEYRAAPVREQAPGEGREYESNPG